MFPPPPARRDGRGRLARAGVLTFLIGFAMAGCGRDPMMPDPLERPAVAITTPANDGSHATFVRHLRIEGTVSGAQIVRWTNSGNATSGVATLDPPGSWHADLGLLHLGANPITIYADEDGRGRSVGTATILVTWDPALDPEPPVLAIALPADTLTTTAEWVLVTGVASDNSGLFDVRWRNATSGESGFALGHEDWQASVPIVPGQNRVFVSATD